MALLQSLAESTDAIEDLVVLAETMFAEGVDQRYVQPLIEAIRTLSRTTVAVAESYVNIRNS